jgi:uncharacterized RDD family membrane protein YckC
MAVDGAERPQYAGFLRRLSALLIDVPVIFAAGLGLVFLPMRSLVLGEAKRYASTDPTYLWKVMPRADRVEVFMLWAVATIAVPWLYYALQESSNRQATLGKRSMGIQITDLDGNRISFGRASGRFFGVLIPTLGVGYCLVLFTKRKQALHDVLAGCVVVRSRNPVH